MAKRIPWNLNRLLNWLVLDLSSVPEGKLMQYPMPNGKPFGECTGDYVRRVGEFVETLGKFSASTTVGEAVMKLSDEQLAELDSMARELLD